MACNGKGGKKVKADAKESNEEENSKWRYRQEPG